MSEPRPLRVFALILIGIGFLSNTLTVVVYLKNRLLRTPINFFLIALTFSDMSMLLISLTGQYIREYFPSQIVCDCVSLVVFAQSHFSVNCFTATAVLRYIHIVHPAFSKRILSWKTCVALLVAMWVEDCLIAWPLLTSFMKNVYNEAVGYCMMDNAYNFKYTVSFAAVALTIPNIIIIYCYLSILIKRMKSRRQVQSSGQQRQGGIVWKKSDLRLFWQVICLFMVFTACWTPLTVLAFSFDLKDPKYRELTESAFVILLVNLLTNPVIYFIFNSEFRKEMSRILFCRKPTVETGSNPSSSRQTKPKTKVSTIT